MLHLLLFLLCILLPRLATAGPCTHHASPQSQGEVQHFVREARPGQTLCLADGRYGPLAVPASFAGTAAQPITIRALNEGKVLIDGGTRRPVDLQGSWGILEGINAQGGDNITFAMRGTNWVARRVVIWNDASNTVGSMVSIGGTEIPWKIAGCLGRHGS